MTLAFKQLSPALGAEVVNCDINALTADDKKTLYQGFQDYGVLLWRGLSLTPQSHMDFSRVFGELEIHPIEPLRHKEWPEVIVLAFNQPIENPDDPAGEEILSRINWHTDLMYTPTPSRGALLTPVVIPPEGGETGWIDMARVFDALPEETREKVLNLEIVHHYAQGRQQKDNEKTVKKTSKEYQGVEEQFPEITHPLVYKHPETGRCVLNISPLFAKEILGLAPPEGERLLRELQDFATREEFIYKHHWQPGDLVLWDNWRTMHRAYGYKQKYQRVMHRTTLKGGATLQPCF